MVNLPIACIMTYTSEGLPAFGSFKEIAEGKIGVLNLIYFYGLSTELIPLLIFLGVGTLMDFSPTIARPLSLVFGATAQLGVFIVFLIAHLSGMFTINEAACIGIIGGSDGPPHGLSHGDLSSSPSRTYNDGGLLLYGIGAYSSTTRHPASLHQKREKNLYEGSDKESIPVRACSFPNHCFHYCYTACSEMCSSCGHDDVW